MASVGAACLIVALITAAYSTVAALYGARSGRRQYVVSARRPPLRRARRPAPVRRAPPPRDLRHGRRPPAGDGAARDRLRPQRLLLQPRPALLEHRHAALLQAHGDVVLAGGLAAPVGDAA